MTGHGQLGRKAAIAARADGPDPFGSMLLKKSPCELDKKLIQFS
jgi:hypothetical protein